MIMANTKLLEREIHNLADGRLRRMTIPFGVRLRNAAGEARAAWTRSPTAVVEAVKGCKPLRCTLTNFGPSSLDYQLVLELKSDRPRQAGARPRRR